MILKIKVIPRSKQNKLEKTGENCFKARLAAPPEKGKANQKLIEFLAKELEIKKGRIKIIQGKTKREKVIEII